MSSAFVRVYNISLGEPHVARKVKILLVAISISGMRVFAKPDIFDN